MKIGRGGKILIYTVLCIFLFVIIVTVGNTIRISNSREFFVAKEYLKSNPEILEKVGEIKDFGDFPSGSIRSEDGSTFAQIEVEVQGAKSRADVILIMSKSPNSSWSYDKMLIKESND